MQAGGEEGAGERRGRLRVQAGREEGSGCRQEDRSAGGMRGGLRVQAQWPMPVAAYLAIQWSACRSW